MKQFSFLLLAMLVLFSCSKKNLGRTEGKSTKNYSLNKAMKAYQDRVLDFETFSAKVKIKYNDGKKNMTVKSTIRMQKDEKIWMSAGVLGFEGVRALVTPDSIFVMNRLQNEYYEESIEELQELSGLPADFDMMQNLLTGKLLLVNEDNATISQQEGMYELVSQLEQIIATAWLSDSNFELLKQQVKEEAKNREMEINYGQYESIEGAWFPTENQVHVSGEDELWIDMEYSNIEVNEALSFPYEVNSRYKKAEL